MRHKLMVVLIAAALFFLTGFVLKNYVNEAADKAYTPGNLIRFHVVAHSDSAIDQSLKLKVRNAVLAALQPELNGLKTLEEAERVIRNRLAELEQIARAEAARRGFSGEVSAQLRKENFPARRYGELILPAGEYQALKVVIGAGEGQNWWCVLFPPLCFVNIANNNVPDNQGHGANPGISEDWELGVPVLAPGGGPERTELRLKTVDFFSRFKNGEVRTRASSGAGGSRE
jgi:stage II sporulation protein R